MKKILLLLTLITFSAFAQNPNPNRFGISTKFVQPDTLSTSQRTALTPKLGTLIYHKDTGVSQWEQWDGDSWEELGGDGAVSSVNSQTGDVLLNADDISDTSTTNKFVTSTEKGLIATALQDAPSDGNEYVRKDGDWEVATGGTPETIYTANGTLPEPRSINIGEYSLSVKDSLGMPLLGIDNNGFAAIKVAGTKVRSFSNSTMVDDNPVVTIANLDVISLKSAQIGLKNTDSTSIEMKAEKFIFNVEGETPNTGDVWTLQADGTTKYQTPSGGGGAVNAENVIVTPSIGGNTDAYAVMDDHEDRTVLLETQIAILTPTFTTTAPSQVISLTKIGGTFYATPEFQDTYTLTGSVDGAFAELAIDTTGETLFPAVMGATLWEGAAFEADEDFSMVVRDIDGTLVYFFLKR